MDRKRIIKIYSYAVVIYGVFTLISLGSYRQFSVMFSSVPTALVVCLYLFSILYGICCVYCGNRTAKLDDWARKALIYMTVVSVVSGLLLYRVVMRDLRDYILSGASSVPIEMVDMVFMSSAVTAAVLTLFELSVIFFFTRPGTMGQFRKE